ncbi:MAG: DUF1631 family protein [Burkholderiaceae bacterium]
MPVAQAGGQAANDERDAEAPIDPARRTELLQECQQLVIARLSDAIAQALTKVGDELTALALRSWNPEIQQGLLDAVSLVRARQSEIRSSFREFFADVFVRRSHGETDEGAQSLSGGLALVDDSVIEERIAIDRIVQRARSKLDPDEVLGVRARLGVLAAGEWFDEARHPAAPEAVFEALRRTLVQLEAEPGVRDALLDALEPYVSSNLGAIYASVNERLRTEHVLPRIRPRIVAAQDPAPVSPGFGGAFPARSGRAAGAGPQGGQAGAGQGGHGAGGQGHGGSGGPGGFGSGSGGGAGVGGHGTTAGSGGQAGAAPGQAGGGTFGGGEPAPGQLAASGAAAAGSASGLIASLAQGSPQTRQAVVRMLADPGRYGAAVAAAPAAPPELMQALHAIQSVGLVHGASELLEQGRINGSPLDQLTIEMVAQLFDQLYADRRLSDPVKQQLLRLQVVAVKTALLDRSFFARREHPMRRLLEAVCRASSDPDVDVGPEAPLVIGLAELVDWLLVSFDNELSVFDDAAARLDLLLAAEAKRREERDSALGQQLQRLEALAVAQEQARAEMLARTAGGVAPFLGDFLEQHWSRVLAATRVDVGEQGWADALACADQLLWSVAPKTSDEVPRLAALLPSLIGELKRGFALVGLEAADEEQFMNALLKAHTEVIQQAKNERPGMVRTAAPAMRPIRPVIDDGAVSPAVSAMLAELERGDIIDVLEADGVRRPFRISWLDPARRLFVLTRFPDVARAVRRAEFARWFAAGRAQRATASGAVERSIAGIVAGAERRQGNG